MIQRGNRVLNTGSDMGLGREMIEFIGLDGPNDVTQSGTAEIPNVQMEAIGEVSDRRGLEPFATPHESVDLIALGEEQLRKVGAVLAGETGDEGEFGDES